MEDGLLQYDERKIGLALRPGPDISYWELQVQEGKRDAVVHQVPDVRGLVLRCNAGDVTWSQVDAGIVHG